MALATLTTKGQVTIPKKVRDSLKLRTGDKIEIVVTDKMEAVIKPISKKVDDIYCKLQKSEQKSVSLEQMDSAIKRFVGCSVLTTPF